MCIVSIYRTWSSKRGMSKPFNGFHSKNGSIKLHSQFFSEVLPLVDDLAELKVLLFCYRALGQKQTHYFLRRVDFANDEALQRGLAVIHEDTATLLSQALEKAVTHGVLLCVGLEMPTGTEELYFMNSAYGRQAVEQLELGNWRPSTKDFIEILPERPTIYSLYEDNIGLLTPMIAEHLKAAAKDYDYQWIVDAIQLAVDNNVRKWVYISAVLEEWKHNGRTDETPQRLASADERDFTSGKYADFIES